MKYKNDIVELVRELVTSIDDDWRSEGCDEPSMDLTCATNNDMSEWSYQTGDNSFSGSCYLFPHWAVVTLTRDSDPAKIAQEICNQWSDLVG